MKSSKIESKLLILISLFLFLLGIFFITLNSPKKYQKRNTIQSSILNKKYEISRIEISESKKSILALNKINSFWGGEYFFNDEYICFPLDDSLVNEFLSLSQEIRTLNKVIGTEENLSASKIASTYSKYGLDEDTAIALSFYDKNKNCVSKIYFGSLNQTMDQIFIRTDNNSSIFSMDSKIINYLESNPDFWVDQNIIPRGISKQLDYHGIQNLNYRFNDSEFSNANKKLFEKIPSLRFSEIISNTKQFELIQGDKLYLKIQTGKGTEFNYTFYPAKTINGDCSIFELVINPDITYTQEEKDFIKKLNYKATLSNWTFNSIVDMLK